MSIVNCQLLIVNCQLSIINNNLSVCLNKKTAAHAGGGIVWNRGNYAAGVMAVMWGFMPSYQYRKPSTSTVSPTFRAPTVV